MEQQILQEEKKPNSLAFKVAIMYAMYGLVLIIILKMLNINTQDPDSPGWQKAVGGVLNWMPFILAIVYVQIKHKKELGGFITYGRAFSAGFKTAAYAALFLAVLIFIYYKFIDPGMMDEIVDKSIEKAGGEPDKISAIEKTRPYFVIFAAFGSAVLFSISGLIISLISAAVVKKDRPVFIND